MLNLTTELSQLIISETALQNNNYPHWQAVSSGLRGRTENTDSPAETESKSKGKLIRQSRSISKQEEMSTSIAANVHNAIDVEIIQPRRNGATSPDDSAGTPLLFEKFSKWYNVLKHDDIDTYTKIMNELDAEQAEILLDGRFVYSPPPKQIKRKNDDRMAEFTKPLNIALSACAFKIVTRMLDDEIDTTQYDTGKANILHVLIISAKERREREEDYLKLYQIVEKYIPAENMKQLLLEETNSGYRPLELAARLCVYSIFKEMLNYPGHLVERSFEAGLNTYSVYNLSEYEGLSDRRRFLRSPLRLIAFTSGDGLESLETYNIIKLPVIEQWYGHLFRRNFIILFIWWVLRCLVVFLMVTIKFEVVLVNQCDHINTNKTVVVKVCKDLLKMNNTQIIEAWLAIGWCIVIVGMDIVEFILCILDRERRKAYKGITNPFRDYAAWTAFYRICQFIQVVLGALAPIMATILQGGDAFETLLVIKALSLPFIMMSILYIVEPLPSIGIFAISLQKMIASIIAFVVFLLPVLLVFSSFFQGVASPEHGFGTLASSMYRLFMLEIGTFDFGSDPGLVLGMVHVTYYLISGILLMNYLIAVMTAAADQTDEDRETLHFLRRLNVVLLAHERYGQWPWRLWMYLSGKTKVKVYGEEDD